MERKHLLRMLFTAALVAASTPGPALAAQQCDSAEAKINPDNQTITDFTKSGTVPVIYTPTTVQLNGQASKGGSFRWTQVSGPTVTFLDDPSSKIVSFVAPDVAPGGATLVFRLDATCGQLSSSLTTNIVVSNLHDANRAPVAVASASPAVTDPEGSTVTLDGSASYDPDGDSLTYAWAQTGGPLVALNLADPARPTFTAPPVGMSGASLTFQLTVSDGVLSSAAPATVIVTVTWVNDPPTAQAACPAAVDEGDPVTLDASGSADTDDGLASYAWTQTVGGPVAVLTGQDLASKTFTFPAPSLEVGHGDTMDFQLLVTDQGDLTASDTCSVQVRDVTPPVVTTPTLSPAEATGPLTSVPFTVGATDGYDGPVTATCAPASPAQLPVGTTRVDCSATDRAGNVGTASFTVTVQDTTPPRLTLPSRVGGVEATGPDGAVASFTATAADLVDGVVPVTCAPASGSTFPLGTTSVACSASDAHGNTAVGSFDVQVVDTTPPVVAPEDVTAEATGPDGAVVTFTVNGTDLVDGAVPATCFPASGSRFVLGPNLVSCSATDRSGNAGTGSFTVNVVDTTPPDVSVPADQTTGPTQATGAVVRFDAPTAYDLVDTLVPASCDWASGSLFPFGTTVVTCTATDAHGNVGTSSFQVTVTGFTFLGFFQPVDNVSANSVKGGSTVPLKWKLQGQGGVEIADVAAVDVQHLRAVPTPCAVTATADLAITTTGGTSLRYDSTAWQYVLNWQTPKQAGTCWRVDVPFVDGSVRSAQFKLK